MAVLRREQWSIDRTLSISRFNEELSSLIAVDHVSTKRLCGFLRTCQAVYGRTSGDMAALALHCLERVTKPIMLYYIAVILSYVTQFPSSFMSSILDILTAHRDYPVEFVSMVVRVLAQKDRHSASLADYIRQLLSTD